VIDRLRALLRGGQLAGTAPAVLEAEEGDPEDPANWVGLDYVHATVAGQLKAQSDLWEEADGRLRLILGVIGIIFAVTLGLLPRGTITVSNPNGTTTTEPQALSFFVGTAAIAGLVMFAAAGLIALVAYWPREFNLPPAPDSLRKYITTSEREIKLTVLDEMLDAYDANKLWLGRKFLAFRWALVLVAVATGLLGASVIIDIAQATRAWG